MAISVSDALTLVGTVAFSFGGGTVVVIALSKWLGNLWAKRILQNELEELRHELGLVQSTYEQHLNLILDYYSVFYRHYRLCQRTASANAHRKPDGQVTYTKEEFFPKLDQFISDWATTEGKLRLLLPSKVLPIHLEAIERFNQFKQAVDEFRNDEESRKKKEEAFKAIEDIKNQMEEALREFLRTEKLLK
jgi:hypothetical protein